MSSAFSESVSRGGRALCGQAREPRCPWVPRALLVTRLQHGVHSTQPDCLLVERSDVKFCISISYLTHQQLFLSFNKYPFCKLSCPAHPSWGPSSHPEPSRGLGEPPKHIPVTDATRCAGGFQADSPASGLSSELGARQRPLRSGGGVFRSLSYSAKNAEPRRGL